MSKLARQLGLPSIPPALRPRASCGPWNSDAGAVDPERCRSAPSQAHDRRRLRHRVGSIEAGTDGAVAIVDGPMRLQVAGLASPDRQGADRLLELEGPVIFAANHHSHLDTPLLLTSIPSRGGTRSWSVQLPTTSSARASPAPCRHSVSGRSRSNGRRPAARAPTSPPNSSMTAGAS